MPRVRVEAEDKGQAQTPTKAAEAVYGEAAAVLEDRVALASTLHPTSTVASADQGRLETAIPAAEGQEILAEVVTPRGQRAQVASL